MPQSSTTRALLWDHPRGRVQGGCWLRYPFSQKLVLVLRQRTGQQWLSGPRPQICFFSCVWRGAG